MDDITLTELELSVLEKSAKREFSIMTATEEECAALNSVIGKAEALLDKLDAYDELGSDLMVWFLNKYNAQQNAQQNSRK